MVGNGAPAASRGHCSVTAGRPKGQRTATRRKARGGRPSCRATTASSSMPPDRMLRALPRPDPLDDEEALPGLDEPKPARLPHERRLARGVGELAFELVLLGAEVLDLSGALDEGVAGVDVGVQRRVVEKPHEAKCPDAGPGAGEAAAARRVSARSQAPFDIACPTVGSSPASGSWCLYPRLGSTARAIRVIVVTASIGNSPTAVSPDSITADVPSRIAFATSLASARVGSAWCTIDSSICVAVMTGLPRSSALRMIRFWTSGTRAGPISTPRSPRATITASASER